MRAGWRSKDTAIRFIFLKVALPFIFGGVAVILVYGAGIGDLEPLGEAMVCLSAALLSAYAPDFYFGQRKLNGIIGDVEKLHRIPDPAKKWLLILCTANPADSLWQNGIQKFNDKFSPYAVSAMTMPHEFPETYFLGLLKVS